MGKTSLTNMYFAQCLFKEAAGKKYFFSEMIDKVIHNLIFGFEYYIKFTFKARKVYCIVK